MYIYFSDSWIINSYVGDCVFYYLLRLFNEWLMLCHCRLLHVLRLRDSSVVLKLWVNKSFVLKSLERILSRLVYHRGPVCVF